MNYLVVCTSGKWQIPIIRKAKSRGLTCIAIDENANAPGFEHADHVIVAELSDLPYIVGEIRKITDQILGAISFCSDAGISLAQALNRDFQCPSRLIFVTENAMNKVSQRRLWKKNHIAQPNFEVFTSPELAQLHGSTANFPLVVKPSDSSGSRGVTIVNHRSDLREAVESGFRFSKTGEIIIEDFMVGTEYTVEVLAIDGKVHVLLITRKVKVSERTRTVSRELRSISPEHHLYQKISELAVSAFNSLGINNSPGHLEMIVDEEVGPVGVVEAAFRGGGFNLADRLVQLTTGFDLTDSCLYPYLDERKSVVEIGYTPSVLFFRPTQRGKLVKISGLDKASEIQGVEIEILAVPGEVYADPTTDGDRLCTIIATASSNTELEEKMKRVEEFLEFSFEDS
jgi:predicted ATP-grasp superfamily ATP-dependent carboligase